MKIDFSEYTFARKCGSLFMKNTDMVILYYGL